MNYLAIVVAILGTTQQWYNNAPVYTTKHWTLRTDLKPNEAHEAGRLLDAVYEAYRNGLSMLPKKVDDRMEAWVFLSKEDYNATVQSRTRGDSGVVESSSGMFFTDRSGLQITAVTVADSWRSFERTAKHEAFHQFAHTRFTTRLPQWVNEGLAEYFEHTTYINGAIVTGQVGKNELQRLQQLIRSNAYFPFIEMMRMTNNQWGQGIKGPRGSDQYLQAWSMVHFLIHGDGGSHAGQFDQFLLLMAEGMNDEEAFVKAFGTGELQAFDRAWANHVMTLVPSSTLIAARRLSYLAAGMLELHNKGRTPSSFSELQASLQSIQYNPTLTLQYEDITFNSGDSKTFTIPKDSFSTQQPVFVLQEGNVLPVIMTQGLRPYELGVQWRKQNGVISWSIVVGG